MFEDKPVLITGGAGFIGSHLTEALVAEGAKVTVVDIQSADSSGNLRSCIGEIEYVQSSILDESFQDLLAGRTFEVIFHFGGIGYVPASVESPRDDYEANLIGTFGILEALRLSTKPSRLVLASSAAVYGDSGGELIGEGSQLSPVSPYGVSKLAADRYAAVYASLYGLWTASLRLFPVYGPRQKKQVVYDFVRKLSQDPEEIEAHGDGTQIRDFIYVGDVARSALCVAQKGALTGEVYNVGSGESCSTRELLELLCELKDVRPRIRWSGEVRPGDSQKWVPDVSLLRSLDWAPAVSLREGLSLTLAWYQTEVDRPDS